MLLDTRTIIRRRQNLRMSQRQVAKQLGVSLPVVTRLEAGTNHEELPLHVVLHLAETLAVRVEQILTDRPDVDPEGASDVSRVGALLAMTDTLTPITGVADALSWDLARVETALEQLAQTAPTVGVQLHRLRGQVKLVPAEHADTADDLEAIVRLHHAREGMNAPKLTCFEPSSKVATREACKATATRSHSAGSATPATSPATTPRHSATPSSTRSRNRPEGRKDE